MQLASVFGKRGVILHRQALGIDDRPVLPPASQPFILEEETLAEDTNDDAVLLAILYGMMERACRRMRAKGMLPRTVWLHLRHTDGVDVTRRLKLQTPVNTDRILFPHLESLYMKVSERRQRIRYLSLTFTDLILPTAQMVLFAAPSNHPKEEALVTALDTIRSRFGETSVQWARVMGHG